MRVLFPVLRKLDDRDTCDQLTLPPPLTLPQRPHFSLTHRHINTYSPSSSSPNSFPAPSHTLPCPSVSSPNRPPLTRPPHTLNSFTSLLHQPPLLSLPISIGSTNHPLALASSLHLPIPLNSSSAHLHGLHSPPPFLLHLFTSFPSHPSPFTPLHI